MLLRAAESYGTPLYLYDLGHLQDRVAATLSFLPQSVDLLYSLKANPSLKICGLLSQLGLGADVASEGELEIAREANFPSHKTMVAGPYKSRELLSRLRSNPDVLLSIDSISEFESLTARGLSCRSLLRLRPDLHLPELGNMSDFSRFGIPYSDLAECPTRFRSSDIQIAGFHVYSGSQILQAQQVIESLERAVALCNRAADCIGVFPERLNLGGGFGIPYARGEQELDLEPIAKELAVLSEKVKPARISLELGRYLVGPCGWYLTSVVAKQTRNGHPAVVVDGGVHHRADICGLNLPSRGHPPVVLMKDSGQPLSPTEVLGCLCLPNDVLATNCPLPPLSNGTVLAFPNSGAYGLSAAPTAFLGHSTPAEVGAYGDQLCILRPRGSAKDVLSRQQLE